MAPRTVSASWSRGWVPDWSKVMRPSPMAPTWTRPTWSFPISRVCTRVSCPSGRTENPCRSPGAARRSGSAHPPAPAEDPDDVEPLVEDDEVREGPGTEHADPVEAEHQRRRRGGGPDGIL